LKASGDPLPMSSKALAPSGPGSARQLLVALRHYGKLYLHIY